MRWKAGSKAYIVQDDPEDAKYGWPSRIGQVVTILATDCGGYSNIKVQNSAGDIFYVRPSWIRSLNQAKTKQETKEIKKAAIEMAENRMREIMEKANKPVFKDIIEKFYALASFNKAEEEPNPAKQVVMELAEKALFEEIKEGVVWE